MVEERVVLEDEPDPTAIRRNRGEVVTVQEDAPQVGALQSGDDPQRALPGAARPEHGHGLTGADLERDAIESLFVSEVDADVLDPQHQNHSRRSRRKRSMTKIDVAVSTMRITASAYA